MKPEDAAKHLLQDRLPLTAFLRTLVRDRQIAEDLFQEVCVQAVRAADSLVDATHVLRWARTTARHRAIDHLRKQKHAPIQLSEAVMERLESDAITLSAQQSPSGRDRVSALQHCLKTLTPNNQRLVQLRYRDDCSGLEVAQTLQRKPEAVYKALSRIYQHLRGCIERRLSS